jgi:hypothetical protein
MSFSVEDRLQFVKWMTDLGPDCDRTRVLRFVQARQEDAFSELVEQPGYEQVRAGLLRLLPDLVPDASQREGMLKSVGEAITAPVQNKAQDIHGILVRHPAWVGLSVLEFCELVGRADGGLDWAVELAGQAFLLQGGSHGVGRGEVLWAMAEQAEEVGWIERTGYLLNEAHKGPFDVAEHEQQVKLLLAMRFLEQKSSQGEILLDTILESEDSDEQTFVHAVWVKAHLLHERNEDTLAMGWIEKGLEALEGSDSSKVQLKLLAFLSKLKGE